MKGDIPAPAFRLLNALPVRTHEARPPYLRGQDRRPNPDKRYGGMGIRVNGVEYESLSAARRATGSAYKTLHKMVANGEAEYV